MLDLQRIDSNWTLFLDRDGVINYEKEADYVRNPAEFRFYEGVLDAMAVFASRFGKIFVITNQKGIGKGWMTEKDLQDIHDFMTGTIENHGGRINRIYFCTDLEDTSPNRKPNPGMGYKAKSEYPDIDFSRSVMVGNTMSDMQFGKTLGAKTIFIPSTKPMPVLPDPLIDAVYAGLGELAKALQK